MTWRILLADDHPIVRQGLRALIEKETDFDVVAEADDGLQALDQVRQHQPDLVIMDLSMPGLNGLEATHQLKIQWPDLKVVVLSQHADRRFVARAFQAGAVGYLLKGGVFEELVLALRAVATGRTYLSPEIAGLVIDGFVEHLNDETPTAILTAREREIVQLIVEGWTSPQIADRLHLSQRTVDTHRRNLMVKLDLHTVADLTKYALREGLTSLDP